MRVFDIQYKGGNPGGYIAVPDKYVFVFNPLYVEIWDIPSGFDKIEILFDYNGHGTAIPVSTFKEDSKARAKVYVSNILQTLFDYKDRRCINVHVNVSFRGDTLYDDEWTCIWGGITVGDRYNSVGVYSYNKGKPYYERNVVWFKDYPFNVTLFGDRTGTFLVSRDRRKALEVKPPFNEGNMVDLPVNTYGEFREQLTMTYIPNGVIETSTFDDTFDATFHNPNTLKNVTNVTVRDDKQGYYLRWIDRFGNLEYFLFVKGEKELHAKASDHYIEETSINTPLDFANLKRNIRVEGGHSIKCAAVNLNEELYAMVETIIISPVIDLYLGKREDGMEIWLPVTVSSESVMYNPNTILQDLEITINLPDINTQTL